MLTKKKVLQSINELPAKFEAEDVIEKIILLEKISIRLKQSDKGKVVSKEEAKAKLKRFV